MPHLEVAEGHRHGAVLKLLLQTEGSMQVLANSNASPFAQALPLSLAHIGWNVDLLEF